MVDAPPFYPDDLDLEAPLPESAAEVYVGRTAFKTGPPSRVGVELEWLVFDAERSPAHVPVQRVRAALDGLVSARSTTTAPDPAPAAGFAESGADGQGRADRAAAQVAIGSLLTTEPGGQLELSSPPAPLAQCLRDTAADLVELRRRLADVNVELVGFGMDPLRPAVRQTDEPRYVAMERHFDRRGRYGRLMMCSTASVQVCLDAGADEADLLVRWRALHTFVPPLVALFANSPLWEGHPTGWRCSRQAVWSRIDPTRTRPPADVDPHRPRSHRSDLDGDPRAAYARYALDAEVLAVRRPGRSWDAPSGLTFRDWLCGRGPAELGRPRLADLDYHLSTLFPPVRPRGHLELRVIDAQPDDQWQLVAAVVATLLDDPVTRDAALAAAEPVAGSAEVAARCALTDPALARAGVAMLTAAAAGMRRARLPADLADAAESFAERFPARGRSQADDLLDGGTHRAPAGAGARRSPRRTFDGLDGAGPDPPRARSPHHDGARYDGARHDATRHDGGRHDGARHDGARHDGACHDGARHDGGRHDGVGPGRAARGDGRARAGRRLESTSAGTATSRAGSTELDVPGDRPTADLRTEGSSR